MHQPEIITRFAPSPTGFLHIGGARTALFNWLFAKANQGKFLLRIEDTDRERSTEAATQAIYDGLNWLGLQWDGPAISQFSRKKRHQDVANMMLERGSAYKCFSTKEEIQSYRENAKNTGKSSLFHSPWRESLTKNHPDAPFVVRIKAPQEGLIKIHDLVQGSISWRADSLDDMILLRSDGTPTYMHAVVVDDHDMHVSHVIRGDDHLINASRQSLLYAAMNWPLPQFAHIPLIHGEDGKKLSKRHGALGVSDYQKMGYTAVAMLNYLARLGWSHGDDELFDMAQAIDWFSLNNIKKSPARLDFKKLDHVSAYHLQNMPDEQLLDEINRFLQANAQPELSQRQQYDLSRSLYCLKERSKTIPAILEKAHFILSSRPFKPDAGATQILDVDNQALLNRLTSALRNATWDVDELNSNLQQFALSEGLKLGKIAQPLRAALSGRTVSPSIFDMMVLLGKDETMARLEDSSIQG